MLVFVYGTLKHGGRLNAVLSGETFLGHTITSDAEWDLKGGPGFPFMYKKANGYNIRGDLYDVSEKVLKRLDHIEGHCGEDETRNFYTRHSILVKNGDVDEEAYVYLCQDAEDSVCVKGVTTYTEDNSKEWRDY